MRGLPCREMSALGDVWRRQRPCTAAAWQTQIAASALTRAAFLCAGLRLHPACSAALPSAPAGSTWCLLQAGSSHEDKLKSRCFARCRVRLGSSFVRHSPLLCCRLVTARAPASQVVPTPSTSAMCGGCSRKRRARAEQPTFEAAAERALRPMLCCHHLLRRLSHSQEAGESCARRALVITVESTSQVVYRRDTARCGEERHGGGRRDRCEGPGSACDGTRNESEWWW